MWFLPRVAHESCIKGVIIVRAGVLKFTVVVDDDTTLHDEHTDKVACSPTVLIKCSISSCSHSLTRTPLEWLEKTIHDKWKYLIIIFRCHALPTRSFGFFLSHLAGLIGIKYQISTLARRVSNVDKRVAFLFAGCSQHLSVSLFQFRS